MSALLWTGFGFLLGSMPFSYWLGRLFLRTDIRAYGDGNPGGTNAWRAGGWRLGVPAMLLDYLKAAVPVGLAYLCAGVSGWGLLPVALGPVLGHAFSPFLRLRGGKAVAATFGMWTGITLAEGPTVLGICCGVSYLLQSSDAWSVVLGMVGFLGYLLSCQEDPLVLAICMGNLLILGWTHRLDLRQPVRPRPYVSKLLRRGR